MKKYILLSIILWAAAAVYGVEILFENDFSTLEKCAQYQNASIKFIPGAGPDGKGALRFHNDTIRHNDLKIPLDLNKVRGRGVQLQGKLRVENFPVPPRHYLGPKLMLIAKTPSHISYGEQPKKWGTTGWLFFHTFLRIPDDATEAMIRLGIEWAQGTLYISDVKCFMIPEASDSSKFTPPEKTLQKATSFRGMMTPFFSTEKDIRDFAEIYHGNLMRWQMVNKEAKNKKKWDISTPEKFHAWLDSEIAQLDKMLPVLRKCGIKIVLDLHSWPSNTEDPLLRNQITWDIPSQDAFISGWEKLAKHYRGNSDVIYGYDLLNEPYEDNYFYRENGGLDWNRLADRAAKKVREIDPVTPIIIEPAMWGTPEGFKVLKPVNVNNVIYSVHVYQPMQYTHQGFNSTPSNWSTFTYPGVIANEMWNKEKIRAVLAPVRKFQQKYNVPIYVGEFSVICWAPGAAQYLDDCISIFEEYGWDWTYHAFREWAGWSIEHDGVPWELKKSDDNPRKQVLMKYLKRNSK